MKLKKILVVDDQEMICHIVKSSLENRWPSVQVIICTDSLQAFQKIKTHLPDLVFLDIEMGEISGPEIAQHMKGDPLTKSIPVVFLTGILTPDEARARQNEIGGEHFLAKPVDFKELIAAVEKYT